MLGPHLTNADPLCLVLKANADSEEENNNNIDEYFQDPPSPSPLLNTVL